MTFRTVPQPLSKETTDRLEKDLIKKTREMYAMSAKLAAIYSLCFNAWLYDKMVSPEEIRKALNTKDLTEETEDILEEKNLSEDV